MISVTPTAKKILIFLFVLLVKSYFLHSVYKHGKFQNFEIFPEDMEINGDDHHNLMIAKNIKDHFTYSDTNTNSPSEFSVWRPPLWPFILSILLLVSNKLFITLVLKVLLEALVITWIFNKLLKKGMVHSLWLLPLFLLEPQYQKYSITFLSESVSAVIMLYVFYLFLQLNQEKRTHILIPFALAAMVLCHPVSIFFAGTLFFFYGIFAIRKNFKTVALHSVIFCLLILVWPIRNQVTFNKGLFITTSQGATLSKGWNDQVAEDFTNVNGDMADMNLNLRYMTQEEINQPQGTIEESQMYKEATSRFFNRLSFQEKAAIAFVKLKSNFNPFPEARKEGFLEKLGILFRVLYVIVFLQCLIHIVRRRKFDWSSQRNTVAFFVLSIIVGQSVISVFAFTGLRFNTIYCLVLLLSFLLLNQDVFKRAIGQLKKVN